MQAGRNIERKHRAVGFVYGIDGGAVETIYRSRGDGVLRAGGHLNLVGDTSGAPVDIIANTDTLGTDIFGFSHIDAITNGDIVLTELVGDMRIGSITSTADDVTLSALNGSIIDVPADTVSDVTGVNITLIALAGRIGSFFNALEVDTAAPTAGMLRADARDSIYLTEVNGTMPVDLIRSRTGDVTLRTRTGGIVDARNDAATNVEGTNINLFPVGGGIGSSDNDLDIDSSNAAAGSLHAQANPGVYINEVNGALNVWRARSVEQDVRLTVADGAGPGNDLFILEDGRVEAAGSIVLRAGDNFTSADSSLIQAGAGVTLLGDFADADPGVGSIMDIGGHIIATLIQVSGGGDNDRIQLNETELDTQTNVFAGGGNDEIIVTRLQTMDTFTAGLRDSLRLDGQAGSDTYRISLFGEGGTGYDAPRDYVVNVLDTGAADVGGDTLVIDGSSVADEFYLNAITAIPGQTTNDPATVRLKNGKYVASNGDDDRQVWMQTIERINYDAGIDAGLYVNGQGGDDVFNVDDMSSVATIDGGTGNDQFRVGRLFTAPQQAPVVPAADAFVTTATTSGHLSQGVTLPATFIGGSGNDQFTVYNHQADITLRGDTGLDSFDVRTLRRADGTRVLSEGQVRISGGDNNDTVLLDTAAPTQVDGGSGFDSLRVEMPTTSDNVVVTGTGVFGGDRYVTYATTERLEVDGNAGDDKFFVLSTAAGVDTRLYGDIGNDIFSIAGDVTLPIVADDPNVAGRSNTLSFAAQSRQLTALAGGLAIDGGTHTSTGRDVINLFNDGSTTNDTGVLKANALAGFGMGGNLVVVVDPEHHNHRADHDHRDHHIIFRGGITYSNAEELTLRLGTGADTLYVDTKGAFPRTVNIVRGANDKIVYFNSDHDDDMTAATPVAEEAGAVENLTYDALVPIVEEAKRRWSAVMSAADIEAAFAGVSFEIADLGGETLATVSGNTVFIDINAAGYGWYVDATASDDSEFVDSGTGTAVAGDIDIAQRMDLLTVMLHEVGHVLGFAHTDSANTLMNPSLFAGQRRTPGSNLTAPVIDWTAPASDTTTDPAMSNMVQQPEWLVDFVVDPNAGDTTSAPSSLIVVIPESTETVV